MRFYDNIANLSSKKGIYANFQQTELKCSHPVQSFQGYSLLLTIESLGVPGTLLIDVTMKPAFGFESANPGLVIVKQLIYYLFIITKKCVKYLKYKLNMINKAYLHPIRASDFSNSVSSYHVFTFPPPSNKSSPHLKLKNSSRNIVQIPQRVILPPVLPSWFSVNTSKTIKAVTLEFCSNQ